MRWAKFIIIAVAATLGACATTETKLPPLDLPAPTATQFAGIERWWAQFNDPQLTVLIGGGNQLIKLAQARVHGCCVKGTKCAG